MDILEEMETVLPEVEVVVDLAGMEATMLRRQLSMVRSLFMEMGTGVEVEVILSMAMAMGM